MEGRGNFLRQMTLIFSIYICIAVCAYAGVILCIHVHVHMYYAQQCTYIFECVGYVWSLGVNKLCTIYKCIALYPNAILHSV